MDIKLLTDLFFTFMKIGGFTVGGGYAMIPIIQHEVVDNKGWVTESEMLDYITLGQSVPGVVGINTATAVGSRVAGWKGSVAATLGMVTPSFVVIILLALVFDQLQNMLIIQKAFAGVRAAVAAMIFIAVIRLYKAAVKNTFHMVVMLVTAAAVLFLKVQPPVMLLLSAFSAVLAARILRKK